MKKIIHSVLVASTLFLLTSAMTPVQANTEPLDQLLEMVKKDRISERKMNRKREAEFLSENADKKTLLKKAKAQLAAEKKRGKELQKQFSQNEIILANTETELENAKGTLGEMFGVVRQASGEASDRIENSVVSAQYPGRTELLDKMSQAKELPTLFELEELWLSLQTEMTQSGKIVKFNTGVVEFNGGVSEQTVTRIGSFNLLGDDNYLIYNSDTEQIQPLGRQPDSYITAAIPPFNSTTTGIAAVYLDPSRGQILGLLTAKATLKERYHQGGTVGYIITCVLVLGLLLAFERFLTLGVLGARIRSQLKNTGQPSETNPLGRILKVYHEHKEIDAENLELKLDEAILREMPRIERGISVIKILAAIAPLLGLLGTVVGMISTFQSITLFGTGDPKIMAGDISMALVTTAMGLIAALPLILIHSIVHARSKTIVHILDEQSAGIIAAHAEGSR